MKKALLISSSFFGYYVDIAEELDCRGFDVDYVRDRPSESVFFKSVGRIDYRLVEHSIERYADSLVERVARGSYDLVLFVGGMSICLSREHVERMRSASGARFVLYLWDALENCQRVGGYIDLFDAVFSFEPRDCAESSQLRFLPLFYAKDYDNIPAAPAGGFDYDACFVGSVHQVSKFENVRRIVSALEGGGARVFCHHYMPSRSAALLRAAMHDEYRDAELSYEPLGRSEIVRIYARSRTVIDSPQGGQSGLTMRTMETLGARRRLITANPAVRDYDFFQCGNVLVCDGGELPDAAFASCDPAEMPRDVYERYSISSWVGRLLEAAE